MSTMDQTFKNTQSVNLYSYRGSGWLRSSAEIDAADPFPSAYSQKARYIGRALGCFASLTILAVAFALVIALFSGQTFRDALSGSAVGVVMGAVIWMICLTPRWCMQIRHGLTKSQAQYWSSNKELRTATKHLSTGVSRAEIIAAAEAVDRTVRPQYALDELYKKAKSESERSGVPAVDLLKGTLARAVADIE